MASWQAIFREIGAEVTTIRLLDRRAGAKDLRRLPALLASSAVPEALVWSETEGRRRLEDLQPDLTLFVTARAWSPSFDVGRPVLLDYVDRLSLSYRQRSRLNRWQRWPYEILARSHDRFERAHGGANSIAAGWSDARALGATWVPVVVPERDLPEPTSILMHDVVFFGSMSYPPNVDAVIQLGRLAPRRWRVLIVGRTPHALVRREAARRGWTLLEDFEDVSELSRRARVSVVPLRATAGIQIKVLEAATSGLPQVVTEASLAGMAPGFVATVCTLGPQFVTAVDELLGDRDLWEEQRRRGFGHVQEMYVPAAWSEWAKASFRDHL